MQKCIIVLGMHRSGTSAISGLINKLGITLGSKLMLPNEYNEKGYFENSYIVNANDNILQTLGSSWNDPFLLEEGWCQRPQLIPHRDAVKKIINREFSTNELFCIKDPRISILLPFWISLLQELNLELFFIIPLRHPLEVAESLKKRDGFSIQKGLLLWMNNMLSIESYSRPFRRSFFVFDDFLISPADTVQRIFNKFNINLPDAKSQIDAVAKELLDIKLKHHHISALNFNNIPSLIDRFKTTLFDLKNNDDIDENNLIAIDEIRDEYKRLSSIFYNRDIRNVYLSLSERDAQINNLSQSLMETDRQIAVLNRTVAERDTQITNFSQAVAEQEAIITSLRQDMTECDGQIVSLNNAVAERDGHIANLESELHLVRASTSWKITTPVRWFVHQVKRAIHLLRILPMLLQRGGGAVASLRKLIIVLHREGLSGVKQRLLILNQASIIVTDENRQFVNDCAGLPNDFKAGLYYELNPDVKLAGVPAAEHYLLHGRFEGRSYSLAHLAINIWGAENLSKNRETVLVVSHDASRTGAPLTSLSIIQVFAAKYNVVALLLGDGDLSPAFRQNGVAVVTAAELRRRYPLFVDAVVGHFCQHFLFKFAIVNTIVSRVVLPALNKSFVPCISLIHEFASSIRPRNVAREALFWSSEVVFSAEITKNDALAGNQDLSDKTFHILPQGRFVLPDREENVTALERERSRIRCAMRPAALDPDVIVVLGVGWIEYRKGVDLFIECAVRVLSMELARQFRFVWIGGGFDPDEENSYSVFLEDQVKRAGLQDNFVFVKETTAITTAYENADVFLLSSRLDPLPNVAIEALSAGVPVLCFENTTGIADFLVANELGDVCVAPYLDTTALAIKLCLLVSSKEHLHIVSERSRIAATAFSMAKYVDHLESLAESAVGHMQQERKDTQFLKNSGLWRADFGCPLHIKTAPPEDQIRCYVRAWASGVDRRKPRPGFNPGIYKEQVPGGTGYEEPYCHYLRRNRPPGPWEYQVIDLSQAGTADLPSSSNTALHVHAHYTDLLSTLVERLARNKMRPDIYVSVNNTVGKDAVGAAFSAYSGKLCAISVVPNKGRDIGPFLTEFGPTLINNYEYIGHLHTKKSVGVHDEAVGSTWYRFLLDHLVGQENCSAMDEIARVFHAQPLLGMVFPDDPNVLTLYRNRAELSRLAFRLGIREVPEYFNFPIGTMFSARSAALAPVVNLGLGWDDYPDEPLPHDGSLLHALERLFSLALSLGNWEYAVTNLPGETR